MAAYTDTIPVLAPNSMKVTKMKLKKGQQVSRGMLICLYTTDSDVIQRFKSNDVGIVSEVIAKDGDVVDKGSVLFTVHGCNHPTVMKDMCADCGADLRLENSTAGNRKEEVSASVAMVHSIPELIVSEELAKELGKADEDRLLKTRKLVLLVDLDQTLIHTTNDNIPPNLKDVNHYQMWHGNQMLWYHTRLRPQTKTFLENISKLFELHICTFGSRMYAHTIARILDPEGKYFSHRILSRDECFNSQSKTANLKALFPCGDAMVCIIDDREDVWHYSPNLVHVKPYRFFQGTADINAPPGLTKTEHDSEVLVHRVRKVSQSGIEIKDNQSEDKTIKGNQSEVKTKTEKSETQSDSENKYQNTVGGENVDVVDKEKVEMEGNGSVKAKDGSNTEGDLSESIEPEKEKKAVFTDMEIDTGKGEVQVTETGEKSEGKEEGNGVCDSENGKESENHADEKKTDEDKEVEKITDKKENVEKPKYADGNKDKSTDAGGMDKDEKTEEIETDELIEWDDEDDYLFYLEEILKTIHSTFYDFYDKMKGKESSGDEAVEKPSLKTLIPYIKKKALKGCNILFSGMIPINMAPEKSRAYIVAKALGAKIHTELRTKQNEKDAKEFTTHLVAAKQGTNKVRSAMKYKNVKKVSQEWLWSCAERWERVEEILFPIPMTAPADDQGRDSPDITNLETTKSVKRKRQVGSDKERKRTKKSDSSNDNDEEDEDDEVIWTENVKVGDKDVTEERGTGGEENEKSRTFSMSYNPMLAFSDDDLAYMDKEVEEEMSDEDQSSEDEDSRDTRLRKQVLHKMNHQDDSSSNDSLSGNMPRGWGLKRKMSPKSSSEDETKGSKSPDREQLSPEYESETDQDKFDKIMDAFGPDSENSNEEYEESIGSADEEIAEAVMKEFLS